MKDVRKFRRSFRYAYEGIKYALSTQQNMQFHFFVAFFVLLMALIFKLSKIEIFFLLLAMTLVMITELINTAIEKAVDLAMPDRHPLAKIAKDVAAASVLVAAVFAMITGMIVFFDPMDRLLLRMQVEIPFTAAIIWVLIALVVLTIIVIQTRFSGNRNGLRPSLLTAVAFAVSTFTALYGTQTLIALLSFGLTGLIMAILHDKTGRSMASLLFGGLIGSAITWLAFYMIRFF